MTWARLLAVVDGGPGSEAVLETALSLGEEFGAAVEALHVEPDSSSVAPIFGEGLSGAAVEEILEGMEAAARERRQAARGLFERRVAKGKVAVVAPDEALEPGRFCIAFRHVVGREAVEVARRGRLSDLIVMAHGGRESADFPEAAFDGALFESGRPVILVRDLPAEDFARKVAVAWNGTREAARAVGAALPLLKRAEATVILAAREGEVGFAPSELAQYLSAHGVTARTWSFAPEGRAIGTSLLEEAGKAEAGLLVMGAYGHSRMREMILGGATRGVLASEDRMSLFLVH
jgi:nucleotide-binding universal stress UspA family protein